MSSKNEWLDLDSMRQRTTVGKKQQQQKNKNKLP